MTDYIDMAARLVRAAPHVEGGWINSCTEYERECTAALMRNAAVMLRRLGDENANLKRKLKREKAETVWGTFDIGGES